ncbi:F-box protein At-B [Diplogelasinospora grovesii]|uniref:F-box protein At-B n=1 Tax=Diplogelasinospora grovesii TaxID=303347 RepID=A0AAN6SAR1_9PEZI|nr:F-box protein At-B [Diplogelasinospora grovesii]
MKTRTAAATGSASATQRELRPRRATDVQGPGATWRPRAAAPRKSSRITRSSAARTRVNSSDNESDDDYHDAATPPAKPQIRKVSSSHKRSASPDPLALHRVTKRRRPKSGFYDEATDDEDELGKAYISPSPDVNQQHASAHRTKKPRHGSVAKGIGTRTRRNHAAVTTKTGRPRTPKEEADHPTNEEAADQAVCPDWASLPYFVLLQIFEEAFASMPRVVGTRWLVATSRVCRAFAEPALTALYRCPPLLNRQMAHGLVALLSKDASLTKFKYRQKVRKLEIDVEEIASKTYRGQPLDFKTLIASLPQLKAIEFYHDKDEPPFRSLDDNLRWYYPPVLFTALNGGVPTDGRTHWDAALATKLSGWRWNSRLMGGMDLSLVLQIHLTPAFAGLKRLCFVNYQVPSLKATRAVDDAEAMERDRAFIQLVADAISVLPRLEDLSIESSTVVNEHFLPLLPKTLRRLELINCWDVSGEDFAAYLVTHGQKLEHLHLYYNQSLNLSFLPVLGTACPNLQTLRMDLKNFNHHEFYNDSEPAYDSVLTTDQVPVWPESIQVLEVKNMRKWEADAAEVFFQSLVDSARKLRNLRYVYLKAMLDVPYRQRSELRDKWQAKLKRAYIRKKEDPQPLFSLRPKPDGNGEAQEPPTKRSNKMRKDPLSGLERRSSRLAMQISNPSSRASSLGRDLRRRARSRPSYAEPDTDDDDLEPEDSNDESNSSGSAATDSPSPSTDAESEDFCQGLCEKVDIQLDNQKPRENTWAMEDFLDDEASDDLSDEDWDGNDRDFEADGYAWA